MPSLAPLPLQGLRSGDVEALTSYICALARVHSVQTTALVSYIVFGVTGRHRYLRRPDELYSVNGYTDYAQMFSNGIRVLGGNPDVSLATCLPWQHWLCQSGHGLLHRCRAWCSDCFIDDRSARRPPYQRLYWCLAPVESCAKHRKLLTTACPGCTAPQSFLPRLPFMDRCDRCGADLTLALTPRVEPTPAQMWDAESTFDLIAGTHRSDASPVTAARFQELVVRLVRELAAGSCLKLGKASGIGPYCLRNWTTGRSRTSLLQAIRLFRSVRCPASALVTGYPLFVDPALIDRIEEEPVRVALSYPKNDAASVRRKLSALVRSPAREPLSLKEVARRLRRSVPLLRYRYPELCKEIVNAAKLQRNSEAKRRHALRERRLRLALEECTARRIYPSDRHLRKATGIHPSDLRRGSLRLIVKACREELRMHAGERSHSASRSPKRHR